MSKKAFIFALCCCIATLEMSGCDDTNRVKRNINIVAKEETAAKKTMKKVTVTYYSEDDENASGETVMEFRKAKPEQVFSLSLYLPNELWRIVEMSNGNLSKLCYYDYEDEGSRIEDKMEFEYDEDDNPEKGYWYRCKSDGSEEIADFFEFKHGKLSKVTVYNSDGTVKEKHKYNDDGNLIKKVYVESGNNGWHEYEYDKKGLVVRENLYTKTDVHTKEVFLDGWHEYEYKYDDRNNLINLKKHLYDADSSSEEGDWEYKYEYDKDGNLIKSTEYRYSDSFLEQDKYEYDKDGNLIKIESQYNGTDGFILVYQYEYEFYN